MKRFTCGLLTVCAILTASSSALAEKEDKNYGGGDTGNVQTNVQTGIITGDDNAVLQRNRQTNEMGRRRGNNVSVQDNDQLCDVAGFVNGCVQESRQENRVRGSRNRRSSYDD